MTQNREYYGPHLLLDCYDGCYADLRNAHKIEVWLALLANLLKMKVISGPHVRTYWPAEARTHDDWGISGFVMIAESHISIHTYPDDCIALIDIFSCRDFDVDIAVNYTRDNFGFKDVNQTWIPRGERFYELRRRRKGAI